MAEFGGKSWLRPAFAAVAAAAALSVTAPAPAQAQGFFEALFGGFDRGVRRQMPTRATSYSHHEPSFRYEQRREPRHASSGPTSGFCVRTCDGRFFRVKAEGGMSAAELCKSFCPATETKIFSGSKIDYSVARDGQRYAELDNAFPYREKMVKGCSCNGKDPYGLATLKIEDDPTLKSGDIVATNDGLVTYAGRKQGDLNFTPIAEVRGSKEWRLRLMSLKVAPSPEYAEADGDDETSTVPQQPARTARPDRRAQNTQQISAQR